MWLKLSLTFSISTRDGTDGRIQIDAWQGRPPMKDLENFRKLDNEELPFELRNFTSGLRYEAWIAKHDNEKSRQYMSSLDFWIFFHEGPVVE